MLWLLKLLGNYWITVIGFVGSLAIWLALIPRKGDKEDRDGWIRAWTVVAIIFMLEVLTSVLVR